MVGSPHPFVKTKTRNQLDELMIEFIGKSPLVFVGTRDAAGGIDISPKGDPAGFVQVDPIGNLLLPERPGNQMTIGFRNILANEEVGLIFVVPNQRETLRATLRRDPDRLRDMQVGGKRALMYTYVEVDECCGKAMVRSQLWKTESWNSASRSIGGLQLASIVGARTESEIKESAASSKACTKTHSTDRTTPTLPPFGGARGLAESGYSFTGATMNLSPGFRFASD